MITNKDNSKASSNDIISSSKQMTKSDEVNQLSNDFNLSLYNQHHKDLSYNNNNFNNNNNNNDNNHNDQVNNNNDSNANSNNKLHNNIRYHSKPMLAAGSTYPYSPYYSISSSSSINLIQSHTYSYCDSSSFLLRTGI